jgi:hypothetical protein
MTTQNIKKYLPIAMATISSTIYTLCAMRVMDSLARHGTITWRLEIYLTKIILLILLALVFIYIKGIFSKNNISSIKDFLKLTYIHATVLVVSLAFVIWQFQNVSLVRLAFRPLRVLFFVW